MIILIVFFFALIFSFFSIKSFTKEVIFLYKRLDNGGRGTYTTIIDVVMTCILWTWFYYLTH